MNSHRGSRLLTGKAGASRKLMLWYGLGALVLGVMLARWSWVLLAPHATAVAVVPEREAAVATGRLFGVAATKVVQAEGAALPNVQLVGVFAARAGKPGFAVLKLDAKRQVGVAVGESVIPGTKLLEIHPDYVLLDHAGMQQRVSLAEKKAVSLTDAGTTPAVRK